MMSRLIYTTMALALASGIGGAAAQVGSVQSTSPGIRLDAAQRAAIVTAVRDAKIPPPNHSFNTTVGARVPPSIELYALPVAALSQAPDVSKLRYTMVQNQVVLVDPTDMRVVDLIRPGE
jgi:hypothetical protein